MPYGNDDWLEQHQRDYNAAIERVAEENDLALRENLKRKFQVPDYFMDLAVKIWWDGKED